MADKVLSQETEAPDRIEHLEPLDTLWRVMGLSGVVWECVWYRRGQQFEFRVQRSADGNDVIALRSFPEIDADMQVCAHEWLDVATAKGFIHLPD